MLGARLDFLVNEHLVDDHHEVLGEALSLGAAASFSFFALRRCALAVASFRWRLWL